MKFSMVAVVAAAALVLTGCASQAPVAAPVPDKTVSSPSPTPTVSATPTTAPAPVPPPAPTTMALGASGEADFGTVTLHGLEYPFTATGSAARIMTAGKQFAVADVEVCPATSESVDPGDFRVITSDSMSYTFWNVQIGAKDPNLVQSLLSPAAGVCTRGFLTFEVDPGKTISTFVVARATGDPLIWTP
ncbi:hypothetical protein [Pengzhenrongella sp.]|uniref:hypothetical protein n=1 Tax=Pengzhenrongella sp. TaxID=2888820 RepID=UPI002F959E07